MESSEGEEDGVVAVSEFDFVSYLEESGQEGVPERAFAHVDASGMIQTWVSVCQKHKDMELFCL